MNGSIHSFFHVGLGHLTCRQLTARRTPKAAPLPMESLLSGATWLLCDLCVTSGKATKVEHMITDADDFNLRLSGVSTARMKLHADLNPLHSEQLWQTLRMKADCGSTLSRKWLYCVYCYLLHFYAP